MEAAADLVAAIAAARAIEPRFHTDSEDQLLADVAAVETLGRIVDGLRLAGAAQLESRSNRFLGASSLAFRHGARDGVELVQQVARIPHSVAKQRVGLGSALAGGATLTGDVLPGRYPVLAAAVAAGEVGVESARVIVDTAQSILKRVADEPLQDMVGALTELAARVDTADVRYAAGEWSLALDQDGGRPRERAQRRKRALRLGQTLSDGTTRLTMILTPEDLATVRELLQSRRRAKPLFRTTPGGDDACEETDPEWREQEGPDGGEPRLRTKEDYDTAMDVLRAGVQAETDGSAPTKVVHQTVVTVPAADLLARAGQGWAPGILAGIPIPVVEQRACSGGLRLLVTGPDGEALYLSRAHRVFSPAQRLALVAAAGGRCQYRGCHVPDPFLEAHHAEWYHRDGGETHIDNGITFCSYHHHLIHAPDAPVEIRRHRGDLWIVPKHWVGPPEPRHRRQSGPLRDPRRRGQDRPDAPSPDDPLG